MKQLSLVPTIHSFSTTQTFAEAFELGKDDLVLTNAYIWKPNFEDLSLSCDVCFQEQYGTGEPSDRMVEALMKDIHKPYKRIIGIGGGTVMDISKILTLACASPLPDLLDGKIQPKKARELVLVPTTCGTGSEVTNIAVFAVLDRNTKKGIANDLLYAHDAVLIPQLLETLPWNVLATSSIDALTHAIESALSPIASDLTKMFSYQAIHLIIDSYKTLRDQGRQAQKDVVSKLVSASLYAGIAFGNAGCGAVHAMAYPLGGTFHIAHGETNNALLVPTLRFYQHEGVTSELDTLLARLGCELGCSAEAALDELARLLNCILPYKALHEYGMTHDMIKTWAESVYSQQTRLLKGAPIPMDTARIMSVYSSAF